MEGLQRLGLAAAIVGVAGLTGGTLAAVQLLPLYELGTFSFRGEGVDYAYASQYSLPPIQLLSVLLPDFFVVNGQYWGLWSRWEVFAYVGIAPLLLALYGVVLARSRLVFFFVGLGLFSLAVALGEHSPGGLHRALSGLPGFSVLRAPGRFLFLFTLCVAMLAAFGADALRRELGPAAGRAGDGAPGDPARPCWRWASWRRWRPPLRWPWWRSTSRRTRRRRWPGCRRTCCACGGSTRAGRRSRCTASSWRRWT